MVQTNIKIPAELFAPAESSRFEGEWEVALLEAGPDDYAFAEPLTWAVDVTNTGDALLVQGVVKGTGTTACARCLEDVVYQIEGQVEGFFLLNEETQAPDDMDDDEFDVLPESHEIDLVPLLTAAVLMDVEDVPLCKDDCLGLCPQCGANLNEGPCACGADPALEEFAREANPFSALANLKFDE